MNWLDDAGIAGIGTTIVLPQMLDPGRCTDVRACDRQSAVAATVQFIDLSAAITVLARFSIQRAGRAPAFILGDLASVRIRASPQARKSP